MEPDKDLPCKPEEDSRISNKTPGIKVPTKSCLHSLFDLKSS